MRKVNKYVLVRLLVVGGLTFLLVCCCYYFFEKNRTHPAEAGNSVAVSEGANVQAEGMDAAEEDLADADVVAEEDGAEETSTSPEASAVHQALRALEQEGFSAGVSVIEIGGTFRYGYNEDVLFYPASAIKGVYCIALFKSLGASYTSALSLAEKTIVESDNLAFDELHVRFGNKVFRQFAEEAGISHAGYASFKAWSARYYPFMTAEEMAQLWEYGSDYLMSDEEGAAALRDLFSRRIESPIKEVFAGSYSKAGWYPNDDDSSVAPATGDSGLVFVGGKMFAVSVMTDVPAELEKIQPLLEATSALLSQAAVHVVGVG